MNIKKNIKKLVAVGLLASVLTACGKNPNAKIVNINKGKDSVSYGYANFVAHYYQAGIDTVYRDIYSSYFGEDYWTADIYGNGNTFEDDFKQESMDFIEEAYLSKQHAKDYGVEVNADDEKKIAKAAKDFMSSNEEDAIKQIGASEEYVKEMLEDQTWIYRVQQKIKDEKKVTIKDKDSIQSTISYVRFFNKTVADASGNQSDLTEEEIAEAKANADAIAAASDFDAKAEELGTKVTSYSFTASEKPGDDETLPADVIEAAQKMSDGEISGVIDVKDEAYYVIRMDAVNDAKATQQKVKDLTEEKQNKYYEKIMDGWKDETDWKVDEKLWDTITYDAMFEAPADEAADGKETEGTNK